MGTRAGATPKVPVGRDHPHAYGDKKRIFLICTMNTGSSPRVWGQDQNVVSDILSFRIIPTRMGTRRRKRQRRGNHQDHPHAYGDKLIDCHILDYCVGSSPRVWGQAKSVVLPAVRLRIIPTRMGTSGTVGLTTSFGGDHPHAYGDKTKEIKENSGFAKSTA